MAKTLKDYPNISLKEEELSGKIIFSEIFGRCGAVHIEVGSGKGTFLVSEASERVDVDYLGIEWARKYYRYAVDRIGRWGLSNVRMIRTEAAGFIEEFVGEGTVECFHIYFPDPWPKKRHHKRRFVSNGNMAMLLGKLKVGGMIKAATDHAGYFEQMEEVFGNAAAAGKIELVAFETPAGADEGELVGTNFERKYIREEREFYAIAGVKK